VSATRNYDEAGLRPDFQDGLESLRAAASKRTPPLDSDVYPIADNGSNVAVRLGIWPTERYPTIDYDGQEYTVFVQIPKRFPTGGGKGFATVPPLSRSDSQLVNNPDWSDGLESVVEQNTDADTAECYSYNWKHTAMNQPEDMAAYLDVADEFLSRG